MKLLKVTLVLAVLITTGAAKASDGSVGPRLSLDDYRAGEFKCPRELAEAKRNAAIAAQEIESPARGSDKAN